MSKIDVIQKLLKQFSRTLLIVAGVAILLTIFTPTDSVINHMFFLVFLLCTTLSVTINSTLIKKDNSNSGSFEDKIKKTLGIHGIVRTYKKKLPKHIGGFIMPTLPVFSVINKRWKKRTKEAIIHENVHLDYIIRQGGILIFMIAIGAIGAFFEFLLGRALTYWIIIPFAMVSIMVFFEYLTFLKTNEIAKKFKVTSKKWSKRYAISYFIFYGVMIMVLYSLITFIRWVVGIIT